MKNFEGIELHTLERKTELHTLEPLFKILLHICL